MPFDARPDVDAEQSGFMFPRDAAQVTPVGTIREPYFAALIDVVRDIVAFEPRSPQ